MREVFCGNAAIVGEARDCFYVRERRPAQHKPLGLEDDATAFLQNGVGFSSNMVRLLGRRSPEAPNQKGEPVSRLPLAEP